jgi:hypothetical protein
MTVRAVAEHKERVQLREGLLERIKVGRIGRQVE